MKPTWLPLCPWCPLCWKTLRLKNPVASSIPETSSEIESPAELEPPCLHHHQRAKPVRGRAGRKRLVHRSDARCVQQVEDVDIRLRTFAAESEGPRDAGVQLRLV